MEEVLFQEQQHYRQWWIWLILFACSLVVVLPFSYGIYSQEVLNKPFGDNPISTAGLLFFGLFSSILMGGVIWLMASLKLKTKISTEGIFITYPPVIAKWRSFNKTEIKHFEIRKYRAIAEYGGWGIKGGEKNKAYNVNGSQALQLYFKNGNKVLIGTQRKQAMEYAMKKMMEGE